MSAHFEGSDIVLECACKRSRAVYPWGKELEALKLRSLELKRRRAVGIKSVDNAGKLKGALV